MKRHKSKKITQSAKMQDCTMRIPGVCKFNNETTVFAHKNGGGGAYKHSDIHGAFMDVHCHDWYDSRTHKDVPKDVKELEFLRAMIETQNILLEQGLIKI